MFTFYHQQDNEFSCWVTEKLKDMVVAHEIIAVNSDNGDALPDGFTIQDLPLLSDTHEQWSSQNDIKAFLEELHRDLKLSRSMQSDACYSDPDNPDQCL